MEDATTEIDLGGLGGIDPNSFMDFDPGTQQTAEPDPAVSPSEPTGQQETPAPADDKSQQEEAAADETEKVFAGIDPAVVDLMKRTAKDNDIDLSDPKMFKLARQIAEKENHIRSGSKAGEPSKQAKDYLAAFRDPEPAKDQPVAKPAEPKGEEAATKPEGESIPDYVKVAREWKEPADFYNSFTTAYEMEEGPAKQSAVANSLMGLQDRMFYHNHMPAVSQMVERMLEERLGPAVREVSEARDQAERRNVVDQLKADGLDDIDELFTDASNGTIEHNGETFPDTWLNRVLVQNPFILKITETGRTPAESKRLTTASRYLAAHQVMKAMRAEKIDPKAVSSAVSLGAAIEKSKRDPDRTGLNKGAPGVPAGKDELDSIFGSGGNSLEALMATR